MMMRMMMKMTSFVVTWNALIGFCRCTSLTSTAWWITSDDDASIDHRRRRLLLLRDRLEDEMTRYKEDMLRRVAPKVQASADAARFLHTDVALAQGNCTRGGAFAAAATTHTNPSSSYPPKQK